MNKQIFTSKEQTILNYILHEKLKEYINCLNNPLNNDIVNENINRTIFDLNVIIKKIKNPNYKNSVEVF